MGIHMSYTITGTVRYIGQTEQVSGAFRKRDLIISFQDVAYEQAIKLQATQDRTDTLDGIAVGQTITAHFNLRGKLTTDKNGNPTAWTNLDVWKVTAGGDTPAAGDPVARPVQQTFDDVPF